MGGVMTPHDQAMAGLRDQCRQVYQQIGRDAMLRQGDPVDTIFAFAKSLIADREYVIGWNDGFEFARRSPDPELVEALSDAEYKLSCLIQRFSEDSIGGYFGAPEDTCTADELCGHWSCAEAGCLKDARDDSRALLSRVREGGEG